MIQGNCHRILNDEEKTCYAIDICTNCEFYQCECVEEFCQLAENHSKDSASKNLGINFRTEPDLLERKNGSTKVIQPVVAILSKKSEQEKSSSMVRNRYNSDTDFLTYDREELKRGCIMGIRHVIQVECGRKTVTDGIGDHFRIKIGEDYKIEKGIENKWEASQPVFISAQTGQGKNFFVEKKLIPYVVDLNYKNRTKMKILIISNRLALQCQINNRIRGNDDLYDEEDGRIYSYKDVVDVMTYHSLLHKKDYLERVQKDKKARYIFVICDEAHFFTSDAMFNPYTSKVLSMIVSLFQKAVRVYLSATPYECLKYIIKYESDYRYERYKTMVFYHFKRDYTYLNINIYSEIRELYGEIVKSVARKEKWLIFIDDKEKCQTVKSELEIMGEKMNVSMKNADSEIGKIYAVSADSKKDAAYNLILHGESLGKDIDVLITTSVLDNGVNIRDIDNIVVSNMSKEECIQMVGRARVNSSNDCKNLYVKRFNKDYVKDRIYDLEKQEEAYHEFELAYRESSELFPSKGYDKYTFLNKYYDGDDKNWRNAKHWFGRTPENPNQLYPNVIAKDLMEKYLSRYKYIYQEMDEEQAELEVSEQGVRKLSGQKYLEYQLSWFGKKYCIDNDITLCGKGKSEKRFLDFLNLYVSEKKQVDKEKQKQFKKQFTELHDAVFPRADKNKNRDYGINIMNKILRKHELGYKIDSKSAYWEVIEFDWNSIKEASE